MSLTPYMQGGNGGQNPQQQQFIGVQVPIGLQPPQYQILPTDQYAQQVILNPLQQQQQQNAFNFKMN